MRTHRFQVAAQVVSLDYTTHRTTLALRPVRVVVQELRCADQDLADTLSQSVIDEEVRELEADLNGLCNDVG